jgi:glycosyltransferase involved in cell wall biosynthesis
MNILLLVKNFDYGGAENHVCELANELSKQGYKVHLISRGGRQQLKLNKEVFHYKMPLSDVSLLWILPLIVYLILTKKIQVIHGHQRLGIYTACLLGKLTGKPIVATIHGKLKYDLRSEFVRKTAKRIIVVSQNSYIGANRIAKIAEKTVLIHNGVQVPNKPVQVFPTSPMLFYGSRFDKRHSKTIEMLITEVIPKLSIRYPSIKLILAGDGNNAHTLKGMIVKTNQKLNRCAIEWKGYSSFLMTELKEVSLIMGVGRVAIEGLCSGIPVYSLNWQHNGTLITRKNFNEFLYGNFVGIEAEKPCSDSIIENINDFLGNPEKYQNEAHLLWSDIRTVLNIEYTAQKNSMVYESLVQNSIPRINMLSVFSFFRRRNLFTLNTIINTSFTKDSNKLFENKGSR